MHARMGIDEALMVRVARGDGHALRELCERWQLRLHQFLYRYTGGRDSDDLQQETWIRVVRSAAQFDPSRRFSTWMFQIALNLARDWHRKEPVPPLAADVLDQLPELAPRLPGVEAAIDVRRLLATLPDEQRAVIVLRDYHDLPEEEVAHIMGCPRGTVKSRLHHAMAKLSALTKEPTP